ncbi:MAG: trypsin-like peptidase domain-containing protein [Myxococcota bacterium]
MAIATCLASCGPKNAPTTDPTTAAGAAAEQRGQHPEHLHGELPNTAVVSDLHASPAPNTAGLLRSTHATTTAYDVSAPATVLVSTRWGHGSGVIIDPKGIVITNYHVVEAGQTESFAIEVGVTTAKIAKDGSAEADKKFRARALKIDPKRDLALLQIEDVKGPLPFAKLAPGDRPRAGHEVSAIGNAGVGFGWAIKHCRINGIGTLESAAQAIFARDAAALPEDQREQMAEAIRKAAADAGLQIQTDCAVLPGDSGGPLIDEETHEVVGINAAIRTSTSGGTNLGSLSYHVHVKEVRDFVAGAPKVAGRFVPNPWELAGHHGALDDSDRDGEVDSFRIGGHCGSQHMVCHGLFVDMDQNSFPGAGKLPPLREIYERRSFDAEWALFKRPRYPRGGAVGEHLQPINDALLYLDTDNDGSFDTLLVDDGETKKARGYRLRKKGPELDPALADVAGDPAKFLDDPEDRERFRRFQTAYNEGTHAVHAERTVAVEARRDDLSGDGAADTIRAQTRFDERTFVDIDQDSIPGLSDGDLSDALSEGKVDAELMAITASPYRVWYDRDNDGKLDLMLEGDSPARGFAVRAATIDADGKPTDAPEHVGRRLLRPGLYDPKTAAKMEPVLAAAFPQAHAAVEDGLSSFPALEVGEGFGVRAHDGTNRRAVAVVDAGRIWCLLDLDGNTFRGANKKKSLEEVVRAGAFDYEFAFIFDGELSWAYYDKNNDGKVDEVWVGQAPEPGRPRHRFVLGKTIERTDGPADTTMFDAGQFRGRLKKSFTKLRAVVVED